MFSSNCSCFVTGSGPIISHIFVNRGECEGAVGVCKNVGSAALVKAQAELHPPHHRPPTRWGVTTTNGGAGAKTRRKPSHRSWRRRRKLGRTWMSWSHWAFSPLMDLTDAFSGEDYVSVSHLKPVLHVLNSKVLASSEEDTELTKHMKRTILQCLKKYGPATEDLLDMASLVDPRFKISYTTGKITWRRKQWQEFRPCWKSRRRLHRPHIHHHIPVKVEKPRRFSSLKGLHSWSSCSPWWSYRAAGSGCGWRYEQWNHQLH